MPHPIVLDLLPELLAVCRMAPDATMPAWATAPGAFASVTRTPAELSLVVERRHAPSDGDGVRVDAGWRALRVRGPLPFDLVGIFTTVAVPLAAAGVPIFPLATFDTDYVLVKDADLARALAALGAAGVEVAS